MILVPPEGPLSARFVPIGEAPGPEEEKKLRPFIGASGKVLTAGAMTAGISRDQMRILNVSPYRLPENERDDVRHHRRCEEQIPALAAELARLSSARTLLLIGAEAVEAVLGLCGPQSDPENPKRRLTPSMFDYHGSTFTRVEALALQAWARENGIPVVDGLPPQVHSVVVVLHPAFALHGNLPRFKMSIEMTIARAARLSGFEEGPARPGAEKFNLMAEPAEVEAYQRHRGILPATVDVETPRDNPKRIVLCGIGDTEKVLVFPWSPEYEAIMRRWFLLPGEIVGHNFLYDLRAFAAYNIRPAKLKRIRDTIVACSRLQPVDDEVRDFPWLALSSCVARHNFGFYHWKEGDRSCQRALYRASFPWCPDELHDRLYNAIDVNRNAWLWRIVEQLLQREGML